MHHSVFTASISTPSASAKASGGAKEEEEEPADMAEAEGMNEDEQAAMEHEMNKQMGKGEHLNEWVPASVTPARKLLEAEDRAKEGPIAVST